MAVQAVRPAVGCTSVVDRRSIRGLGAPARYEHRDIGVMFGPAWVTYYPPNGSYVAGARHSASSHNPNFRQTVGGVVGAGRGTGSRGSSKAQLPLRYWQLCLPFSTFCSFAEQGTSVAPVVEPLLLLAEG